jgi:hypothetical protein
MQQGHIRVEQLPALFRVCLARRGSMLELRGD